MTDYLDSGAFYELNPEEQAILLVQEFVNRRLVDKLGILVESTRRAFYFTFGRRPAGVEVVTLEDRLTQSGLMATMKAGFSGPEGKIDKMWYLTPLAQQVCPSFNLEAAGIEARRALHNIYGQEPDMHMAVSVAYDALERLSAEDIVKLRALLGRVFWHYRD